MCLSVVSRVSFVTFSYFVFSVLSMFCVLRFCFVFDTSWFVVLHPSEYFILLSFVLNIFVGDVMHCPYSSFLIRPELQAGGILCVITVD